ncbi:hypothetical protein TREMEDRAFT_62442 [Tremella mesenterica DSM 1558]|uniref:uncharacterized protein n=1 Tax=Tremella mesenterica (strain ATCC 24925 / CBS 8224 / DSM 1558 / NBRC 9311 / NRRL Y-6157 / RJB 2259-6 / UBC 559-6) TaxID=578456 RepID=UPI0003F49F83|nr:uncharacterized protein TREMEDRAFT_62442 [Tremella mesenterica DSM 1558]EIW69582.1 hypothetical protein TREMEDRAFT_62442 [Tremella mesenterica DSM 1558]
MFSRWFWSALSLLSGLLTIVEAYPGTIYDISVPASGRQGWSITIDTQWEELWQPSETFGIIYAFKNESLSCKDCLGKVFAYTNLDHPGASFQLHRQITIQLPRTIPPGQYELEFAITSVNAIEDGVEKSLQAVVEYEYQMCTSFCSIFHCDERIPSDIQIPDCSQGGGDCVDTNIYPHGQDVTIMPRTPNELELGRNPVLEAVPQVTSGDLVNTQYLGEVMRTK